MNPKIMDAVGFIGRFVADHWESMIDQQDIQDELLNLGFSSREISDAFKWIEKNTLGGTDGHFEEGTSDTLMIPPPIRVLSAVEKMKISPEAYGTLVKYYDRGLIDPVLLEEIIERAMHSESEELNDHDIRKVASLAIFNKVQAEWRDFLHTTNTLVH